MVEISEKMNKVLKSTSNLGQDFNSLYRDLLNCSYKISGYMEKLKKQIGFLYNITSKLGEKYSEVQQVFKMEEVLFLKFRASSQPCSWLSAIFPAMRSGIWKGT